MSEAITPSWHTEGQLCLYLYLYLAVFGQHTFICLCVANDVTKLQMHNVEVVQQWTTIISKSVT